MSNITKITDISINENVDNSVLIYNDGTSDVTISDSWNEVVTEQESRLQRIEQTLEKIADRLAILDEPNEERLEQFKALKKIYKKYKFVDALCGEEKTNDYN